MKEYSCYYDIYDVTIGWMFCCGCKAGTSIAENQVSLEQEDYLQYQQYQEKGCLDEDGQYFDPDLDVITSNGQEKPSGKIHIAHLPKIDI
ncbi:MAG: hypothetical protein ACLSE4_02315 [Clostridium sp.]